MPPANVPWQAPVVNESYSTSHSHNHSHNRNHQFENVTRRVSSRSRLSQSPLEKREAPLSLEFTTPQELSSKTRRSTISNRRVTYLRAVNVIIWLTAFFLIYQYKASETLERIGLPHTGTGPHMEQTSVVPELILPANNTMAKYAIAKATETPKIIHVIHTRFMQNQPHLINLGLARLELLKSFTIASLEQQTSSNFLWVIRTDPNLNITLREPLLETLKGQGRQHLLIASNENPNIQIHELTSLDPASIWSGDAVYATRYLDRNQHENDEGVESSGTRRVLETRLDADDALQFTFVQKVQTNVLDLPFSKEPSWRIWCASRHIDWQYHVAWEKENSDSSAGALLSLNDKGCISAGLTIGYTEGVQTRELPPIKHDQLGKTVPSCKKKKEKSKCLDFIDIHPTALRARTPTSAGMLNVMLGEKGKTNPSYLKGAMTQKHLQDRLWDLVGPSFGYAEESATQLHGYLESNMHVIALDNLNGQCTSGHSCKNSSRILLQSIIAHPNSI